MLRKSVSSALFAAALIAGPASVCLAGTAAGPVIVHGGVHDVSPPLRSIKDVPPGIRREELEREILPNVHRHVSGRADPLLPPGGVHAPAPTGAAPTSPSTFEGEGAGLSGFENTMGSNYIPPDMNGDVGPNHYVQWLNAKYAIFDKSTHALVKAPTNGNALWLGFPTTDGNTCATHNDGDPIVQYDQLADRWVLTQFDVPVGGPYFQCVAVSTGPDPTGSYNRYDFQMPFFNDYPKLGVWPDAYYMTFNMFNEHPPNEGFVGGEACALDRINMLAGNAATAQCFGPDPDLGGGLPIDFDGPAAERPPAGEAAIFLAYGNDPNLSPTDDDALLAWKFHVDWDTPANTTFTGPAYIDVATFTAACPANGTCMPQLGTSQKLDSLSDRLMYRLAYRNLPAGESILVNHSIQPGLPGTGVSGIRWYELRLDGSGNPSLYQQGTFAPADGKARWMGSIAMDATGNIAVGYSISSSSTRPSIAIASRSASDSLGTLGNETTFFAGSASQIGADRWGDYTAMSIDPTDGCTFWYTNEYYTSTGENWRSKIGSFRLPNAAPSISGPSVVCAGDPILLTAGSGFDSYQWYLGVNQIAGATGSTYSVASASAGDGGSYTVVGKQNGCTTLTSTTLSVTVDSPATPAILGSTVVCPGGLLHLTATAGASSYQWSLGGNPISGATSSTYSVASAGPGNAGDYTVTSTDSHLCTSAASPVFHVALDTPPAAPAVSGPSSICLGNSLQLSATAGASSYQWSLDTGSGPVPIQSGPLSTYTVASAAPSDAGNYTVTATDSFSCTSPSSTSFAVGVVACTVVPQTLAVDGAANGGLSNGNGIFEPGETVVVDPGWNNTSALADVVTGAASLFSGKPPVPSGPTYTVSDAAASYGSIAASATADCKNATANCFALNVNAPTTRPAVHWDAQFTETPSGGSAAKIWTLHLGDSFSDVPRSDVFYGLIETLLHNNITVGCGTGTGGKGLFCESQTLSRGQMAVFIARALLGGDANVPISGPGYNCIPSGGSSQFTDVPPTNSFCPQVNYLATIGVTLGCGGGNFCVGAPLTRGQMAAFVARALVGGDPNVPVAYGPDPGTGRSYDCGGPNGPFPDVAPTYQFCAQIGYIWAKGIVDGFSNGTFGPDDSLTRGQGAKFIVNGFGLKLYGP